jgi:uncharacterized membrane protein
MGLVKETIHINAPIDRAWDLNADCRRIPEWNTSVLEVKDCPDRTDRVGARYTTVARIMGRKVDGTFETTTADRPRLFEQKAKLPGGGDATLTVTFVEASGGTDLTVTLDYVMLSGGLFSGIAEKLLSGSIERDIHHSNANFKALCEASVPAHA